MEENFNPYLKWLGIPLKDQPPNHYQLLGIPAFMDDADVISNSADRQMGHVRNFASGKYSQLSQKLLNEIAAAKVCLLTPAKKQAYDQQLRSLTSAASSPPQARPLPQAQPVLHTRPQPQRSPLPGNSSVPILEPAAGSSVSQRVKKKSSLGMMLAGVVGLLIVGGAAAWMLNRPAQEASREETSPDSVAVAVADHSDADAQTKESAIEKENETPAGEQARQDPMAVSAQDPEPSAATPEKSEASAVKATGESASISKADSTSEPSVPQSGPQSGIDLLKQIDLKRDSAWGDWTLSENALSSPQAVEHARFMLPGEVPKEYVLEMEVERIAGDNMLFVGLIIAGQQREFYVDWHADRSRTTGFSPAEIFPPHRGVIFQNGQSRRLRFQVTTERVVVSVDGKTLFDLRERFEEITNHHTWEVPNKKVISLGSHRSSYRFTKVELTPLEKGSNPNSIAQSDNPPAQNKTSPSVDLLKQIDVSRDQIVGEWTYDGKTLNSPTDVQSAKLMLPGEVPDEYVLELEVERVEGDNTLVICFLYKGKQRELFIDWREPQKPPVSGFAPESVALPLKGAILQNGKLYHIELRVALDRVTVNINGKTLWDIQNQLNDMYVYPNWAIQNPGVNYLGTYSSHFRFTKIQITPLDKDTSAPDQLAANSQTPPAEKLPLPTGPELEKAQKTLSEVFKEDLAAAKSTEQKRAIAQTLLKHATEDSQKPVETFVLLKAARSLAISGADPETAMQAIDLLDETFVIEPLELKADTLTDLSKSAGTTEEEVELITAIGEVVRQMVEAEQFDAAKPLTRLAQSVAIRTRNADLRRKLAASIEEFDKLHEAFRKIQPALETLQTAPDDPEANLTVGRYRAFSQLNWEVGLKHLAAGGNETLSDLAKRDLTGTENSTEQLDIAEAWWKAADKETSDLQAGPKIRSAYWYRKALPSLTGLTREKILKRLEEIRELDPSGDIHPEDWELWLFDGTRFHETEKAKIIFDSGALSLKNNLDNFLLLVYQPYVSNGPFLATLEIKGALHAVGLAHVDRSDQSMGSDGPRDEQWHTVTIERLADKSLIVMIDGKQVNVRQWKTDNNLVGKIAIWLQIGQHCSIRRFEVQTPPYK